MRFTFTLIIIASHLFFLAARACNSDRAMACLEEIRTNRDCEAFGSDSSNKGAGCSCGRFVLFCLQVEAGCCQDSTYKGNCDSAQQIIDDNCAAPCFHRDTLITYQGRTLRRDEIHQHPECTVPHTVWAKGVRVTARCDDNTPHVLRVTQGHLVYSNVGLVAASALKQGHHVYADLDQRSVCTVVSVEREEQSQPYFGLNCLTSHVLADGLKTSTFETVHTLPALWMHVVGRLAGIERASYLGDCLASWAHRVGLV